MLSALRWNSGVVDEARHGRTAEWYDRLVVEPVVRRNDLENAAWNMF